MGTQLVARTGSVRSGTHRTLGVKDGPRHSSHPPSLVPPTGQDLPVEASDEQSDQRLPSAWPTGVDVALLILALRHVEDRWAALLWKKLTAAVTHDLLLDWLEQLRDPCDHLISHLMDEFQCSANTLIRLALLQRPAHSRVHHDEDLAILAATLNIDETQLLALLHSA